MVGAFWSEWVKLRRRAMLAWGLGGMLFFSVLATFFTFQRAVRSFGPGFHEHGGFRVTIAELSRPDGLVHGITHVSTLVGIVSLALFAGATATEYSLGTLQPARPPAGPDQAADRQVPRAGAVRAPGPDPRLCGGGDRRLRGRTRQGGKHLGVDRFDRAERHLPGAAARLHRIDRLWRPRDRPGRDPALAGGGGRARGGAYALPGEAIINALWDNGGRWLPGQLLDVVAGGGSSSTSYARALLLVAIYAVVAAAGTLALFARRGA